MQSKYNLSEEQLALAQFIDRMDGKYHIVNVPTAAGELSAYIKYEGSVEKYAKRMQKELRDAWFKLPVWDKKVQQFKVFNEKATLFFDGFLAKDKTEEPVTAPKPVKEPEKIKVKGVPTERENANGYLKFYKILPRRGWTTDEIVAAIYLKEKSRYNKGGKFYDTAPQMEASTAISRKSRITALKGLVKYGVVTELKWCKVKRTCVPKKEMVTASKHGKTWFLWHDQQFKTILAGGE
jgi:hypothetical protein